MSTYLVYQFLALDNCVLFVMQVFREEPLLVGAVALHVSVEVFASIDLVSNVSNRDGVIC